MDAAVAAAPMSPEAYLAFEREAEARGAKHEYVDGFVYAMAGASRRHAAIVRELILLLGPVAKRAGCDLYGNDVKVHVVEANCYYYPDVVVACDPGDRDPYVVERPRLVAEVLSPTTASTDRREKLINYLKMPSLTDILLVDPDSSVITHYRRGPDDGDWQMETVPSDGSVLLSWTAERWPAAAVLSS